MGQMTPHSGHVTSNNGVDTLICHTTLCRNYINFLYNPSHVTLGCVEVGPMVYARVKWHNPTKHMIYIAVRLPRSLIHPTE